MFSNVGKFLCVEIFNSSELKKNSKSYSKFVYYIIQSFFSR